MLSKAQNKYIRSLSQQKYRREHRMFLAEGDKIAREWLESSARIYCIVALEGWLQQHQALLARHPEAAVYEVVPHELEAVSTLTTPNQVLLVVHMPDETAPTPHHDWALALDNIQDPGNMGTIIRIADWFGITQLVCGPDCVDLYNPKVVQAAMGGHLRVGVHVMELTAYIQAAKLPVYAATLHGADVYDVKAVPGIILIGNESKGVSPALVKLATQQLTIPRRGGAESLNAAISTGILCALLVK